MAEEDNVFEIEKILESFVEKGVRYYRVRWKGFGEDDDTWEPQENLIDCKDVLDKFWKEDQKYKQTKVRKRSSESTSQTIKKKSKKKRQGRTTNNSTIVRIDSPSFQGKNVTLPKEKIKKSFAKQTKTKRKHISGNETRLGDKELDTKRKNKSANKKRENSLERKKKRKTHAPKDSFPESKLDSPLQEKTPLDENQNTRDFNVTASNSTSTERNAPVNVVEDSAACSSPSAAKAAGLWRENSRESLRQKRSSSSFEGSPEYVPEYCDEALAYDFVSEEEYEYFGDTRYIVKDRVGYGERSSVESIDVLDKDESPADHDAKAERVSFGREIETEERRQGQEDIECSNVRPRLSLDFPNSIPEAEHLLSCSTSAGIGVHWHANGDTVSLNSKCNTARELYSETKTSPGKNVVKQTHGGGLDYAASHVRRMESETNKAGELFSRTVASVKKSDMLQCKEVQTGCLDSERNATPSLRTHGNVEVLGTRTSDDIRYNQGLLCGSGVKTEKADHNKCSRKDDQKPEIRASLSEDSAVLTDSECMSPEFHKIPKPRKEVFHFPAKWDGGDTKETLTHAKRSSEIEFGKEKNEAGDTGSKEVRKIDLCVDHKNETCGKNAQIESLSSSDKTRENNKHCKNNTASFQEEERPDIMEKEVDCGLQSVCSDEIKSTDRPQNLEQKSADNKKFSSVGLEKGCHDTEKNTNQDVVLDISEEKSKVASNCGVVKKQSRQKTKLNQNDKPCKTSKEKSQRLSTVIRGITTPEIIEIDVQSSSERTSGYGMPTENSKLVADVQLSDGDKRKVTGNISDLARKPHGSSEINTKRKKTKLRLSLKRKPDKSNDESFEKKCKQLPLIEEGSQEVLSLLDKSTKPIQEAEATDQRNQVKLAELKYGSSVSETKDGDNTEKKGLVDPDTVIEKLSRENVKDPPSNIESTKIIEKDSQKSVESFGTGEKLHRQVIFSVCESDMNYSDKCIETEEESTVRWVDGLDQEVSDSVVKKLQVVDDIQGMPHELSANLGKSIDSSTADQKMKQKVADDLTKDAVSQVKHLSLVNVTDKSSNMTKEVVAHDESQKNYELVIEKVVTSGEETFTSSATVEQKLLSPFDDPSLACPEIVKQTLPGPVLHTEPVFSEPSLNVLSRESESIIVEGSDDKTEKEQIPDSVTFSSMQTTESEIVSFANSAAKPLEVSHAKDMHPHFTQAVAGSPVSVMVRHTVPSGSPGMLTSTTNAGGDEKYTRGSDYVSWSSDTSRTYPYSGYSSAHLSQNPFLADTTPFVANTNQFLTSHVNQQTFLTQSRYSFANQVGQHPFSTQTSTALPNQKPFSAVAGINWYPEHKNKLRQRHLYPIAPKTFVQRPFFVVPPYPLHPQYPQQVLFDSSYARALRQMATRRQPENQSVHTSTSFDNKEYSSSIDADKAWYAKHVGSTAMVSSSNNCKTDQSCDSSLPKEQKAEGNVKTTNSISQAEMRTINTSDTSQSNNIKAILSEPIGKTSLKANKIDLTASSLNQSSLVSEQSSSYKNSEKITARKDELGGADKISSEDPTIDKKSLSEVVRGLKINRKNLSLEETSTRDNKTISNLSHAKISDSPSIDKEQTTEKALNQFAVSTSIDSVSNKDSQSEDKSIGKENDKNKDRTIDKEKDKRNKSKDKASSNSDSDRKSTSKSSLSDSKKSLHKTNDKSEKYSSSTSRRGGSKEREQMQDLSSSKERRNDSEKTFGKDKEVSRNKEDVSKTGSRCRVDSRRSKRDSKGKYSELKSPESVDSELEFDFDDYSPGEVVNEPEKVEKRVTQTGGIPTALSLREVKSAIRQGDAATVLASLAGGMNVDSQDGVTGMTLLMRAVSSGQENIVRLLLNHGANINIKNNTGITPLIEACEQGFENIVSLLLNAEIDINAKQTLSGETALIKACMKGHYNVVSMLLAHGADSQMRSVSGLTAAQLAVQCGQFEIRDLLESHNKKLQRCVETAITSCLCDSNKLMYPPLLPFVSLYPAEGQKFTYHFHCSDLLLSKTILLFCLRAVFSRSGQVDLSFAKDNGVHTVLLNGSLQSPVLPSIKSVFVLKPKLDTNRLILQTYQSHVHLLVCIYATELDENILNAELRRT